MFATIESNSCRALCRSCRLGSFGPLRNGWCWFGGFPLSLGRQLGATGWPRPGRWWILLVLALAAGVQAEPVWVGRFPSAGEIPAPWQLEKLNQDIPATRYRLREWDGVNAVEAHALGSMALLGRPLTIDLVKTPVLCWRWRIDAPLKKADMTRKSGDDYAARVYLSFAVPPDTLSLGTRLALGVARALRGDQVPDAAINYIWDNRHPVGTWQANTYTDRARMRVTRSGAADAGRWVSERRQVADDFRQAFGHAPLRLTGIALASDTDNTGEEAHAGFADFRFVGREEAC
ncbi:MAG: DUF3047 domain-containing protein [Betaproteobacteria bacterium]|nr:DUF3047 domain-containing protein [Betaproteobacteria bacterium]